MITLQTCHRETFIIVQTDQLLVTIDKLPNGIILILTKFTPQGI